ncbi:UNVERIFIED_CONTAM: Photosystem I reaction center subunit V, chloroplastic [Sesamum latifolium]|uniref:PSI-G n=1 Tax=Sesamum latifolium TaxID=2727402 RepID=A0AAW2WRR7_9LAMI
MASTLFSTPTFQGLRPLNKPTDSTTALFLTKPTSATFRRPLTSPIKRLSIKSELSPSLVISLSTGLSLFLGRFVFFNFQRENVAKQGLPEQNGVSHFEAGDVRAKEYVSLLKSNDPSVSTSLMFLLGVPSAISWLTTFLPPLAMATTPSSLVD